MTLGVARPATLMLEMLGAEPAPGLLPESIHVNAKVLLRHKMDPIEARSRHEELQGVSHVCIDFVRIVGPCDRPPCICYRNSRIGQPKPGAVSVRFCGPLLENPCLARIPDLRHNRGNWFSRNATVGTARKIDLEGRRGTIRRIDYMKSGSRRTVEEGHHCLLDRAELLGAGEHFRYQRIVFSVASAIIV